MPAPPRVLRALNYLDSFHSTTLKDLEAFTFCTFLGNMLRRRCQPGIVEPIFNAVVESIDRPYRDRGFARYASTNPLLTMYMQKRESQVNFAKWRPALHVCVRMIGTIMASNVSENKDLYLIATGDQYLLTSCNFWTNLGTMVLKS